MKIEKAMQMRPDSHGGWGLLNERNSAAQFELAYIHTARTYTLRTRLGHGREQRAGCDDFEVARGLQHLGHLQHVADVVRPRVHLRSITCVSQRSQHAEPRHATLQHRWELRWS